MTYLINLLRTLTAPKPQAPSHRRMVLASLTPYERSEAREWMAR